MKRFVDLFYRLEECEGTTLKYRAVLQYLRNAPAKDAELVCWMLNGNKPKQVISFSLLKKWILTEAGIPEWLFDQSHDMVKDQEETLALIIEPGNRNSDLKLSDWIDRNITELQAFDLGQQQLTVVKCFQGLSHKFRLIYLKLLTGKLKLCCDKKTFVNALSTFSGLDEEVLNFRLSKLHYPQEGYFKKLLEKTQPDIEGCRPYPFMSAIQFEEANSQTEAAIAEWKWKGIRVQLVKRKGKLFLWSKDHEYLSDRFPELVEDLEGLADNIVIDAQLISESDTEALQKRLTNRLSANLVQKYPVVIIAFDILEKGSADLRGEPLYIRKEHLRNIFQSNSFKLMRLTESLNIDTRNLLTIKNSVDYKLADGLIIKDSYSLYYPGSSSWYTLKKERACIKATLLYIQRDYESYEPGKNSIKIMTFGVPEGDTFVSVAKTGCDLPHDDIIELESYIKENTTERIGPIRVLKPGLIFELTFDEIIASKRHKSGICIISPGLAGWEKTLSLKDIDHLDHLRNFILE